MKTFKQYIKEAVDFRLGGSENKGVAEIHKSFKDLEGGDYLHIWWFDESNLKLLTSKIVEVHHVNVHYDGNVDLNYVNSNRGLSKLSMLTSVNIPEAAADDDSFIYRYDRSRGTLCFITTYDMDDEDATRIFRSKI